MYEVFYNLKAEPFRLSPDHKFCYEHKGYAKARAYMAYAFKRAEGFVMITGRPGTGKTTLVGELVESLASDRVRTANLVCTQLQADDLLKTVAFSFGISSRDYDKAEILHRLTTLFQRWHQEGGRALLIVDEAQDLSVSAMEELRLLTNIQIGGQPLVQIFLLGQPELRDLVMAPEMEQVHQRVIAASHLRGLEVEETEAYVVHRLNAVGWKGDPAIDRAIFPLIHKFSEGVPRRINLICSRLFLLGSVEQRHEIEVADVRDVIGELQAENLAAGSWFSEADFDVTRDPEWLEAPGMPAQPHTKDGAGAEPAKDTSARIDDIDEAAPENLPEDLSAVDAGGGDQPSESAEKHASAQSIEEEPKKKEGELLASHGEAGEAGPEAETTGLAENYDDFSEQAPATVDVVEELFDVVTARDSVNVPETGEGQDDMASGGSGQQEEAESQGRRYFSGRVIAESALASEEAAAELANLPEDFIADSRGDPLPEVDPSDADSVTPEGIDELQRDGKAWPLASRPAANAPPSSTRTRSAIVILTLAALVGASVFFLELYLSREDSTAQAPPVAASEATKPAEKTIADRQDNGTADSLAAAAPSEVQDQVDTFAEPVATTGQEPDPQVEPDRVEVAQEIQGVEEGIDSRASDALDVVVAEETPEQQSAVDALVESSGEAVESTTAAAATSAREPADADPAEIVASAPQREPVQAAKRVPAQPVVKQVFVVNFGFDTAALGQDANAVLARAVQKLQQYPDSTAIIAKGAVGQTPGAFAARMAAARAGAVRQFFLDEGVSARRISIENADEQELASSVAGQDSQRTVQVTVSRMLEG